MRPFTLKQQSKLDGSAYLFFTLSCLALLFPTEMQLAHKFCCPKVFHIFWAENMTIFSQFSMGEIRKGEFTVIISNLSHPEGKFQTLTWFKTNLLDFFSVANSALKLATLSWPANYLKQIKRNLKLTTNYLKLKQLRSGSIYTKIQSWR